MAGELRDASLTQSLLHDVCLSWLSVDVMRSEKAHFCYNMAPEGKPAAASSGAPLHQQQSFPALRRTWPCWT